MTAADPRRADPGRGVPSGAMTAGTLRRHRWNTGFVWRDHTGPFRQLSEQQVRDFDEQGFLVLPEVFSPDELGPVLDETDRFDQQTEEFLARRHQRRLYVAEGGVITYSPHLVRRSPLLADFVRHPLLLGLCADLVGPDVNLFYDKAVYKKPHQDRRVPWHQANAYPYVDPQDYLTCWVALTDATVDNGCPQVAPGIHRAGTLHHDYLDPLGWECFSQPPSSVTAPVPAGSVVVLSSLTPHLTGPNRTDAVRKAYVVQYAPDGAAILDGEHVSGAPAEALPQNDPQTQFPVLRRGRPVG